MKLKRPIFRGSNTEALRQHGFTLLETLVAMMILSIALVIIFQLFSGALNAGHISEAHTRAVWHAREKMDELLRCRKKPGKVILQTGTAGGIGSRRPRPTAR
jgi:prepilin-type N-terminal cleavage/methylation domain-containing protein